MTDTSPLHCTDKSFESAVLAAEGPVLVDFWAPWCGPCRALGPSVDQLAIEFHGRARVGKLNIDENQETATRYQVRSIPTLLIFKNGQVVDKVVGAVPIARLRSALANHARASGTSASA